MPLAPLAAPKANQLHDAQASNTHCVFYGIEYYMQADPLQKASIVVAQYPDAQTEDGDGSTSQQLTRPSQGRRVTHKLCRGTNVCNVVIFGL